VCICVCVCVCVCARARMCVNVCVFVYVQDEVVRTGTSRADLLSNDPHVGHIRRLPSVSRVSVLSH
jgi:hypothetical protein